MTPLVKKEKIKYPFSKLRVYFNVIFGTASLLFSLIFLISYSDTPTTLVYTALTVTVIMLSTRLKLYLLKRIEKIQLEPENQEQEDGGTINWKIIVMAIVLAIVLMLPVITALFVNPLWWFISFSSFTVGFSLSEILLYLSVEH
jgi:hypothetical protein